MVLEDFEPSAPFSKHRFSKAFGAHDNQWQAWIDFAHAQPDNHSPQRDRGSVGRIRVSHSGFQLFMKTAMAMADAIHSKKTGVYSQPI